MTEEWKAIEGYEGLYEISNKGRVYSVKRNKYLSPYEVHQDAGLRGHRVINLYKNGVYKGFCVHRLVALAFIPNPKNLPVVNHKDGNKQNNNVENLEWCTQKENVEHAIREGRREKVKIARERRWEECQNSKTYEKPKE